jgi:hypothetical protein
MKKLLTFLMMSILAIGIGWADTMTFTTSSEDTGTLSGGPSGVSASITTAFVGYTNGQGAQLTGGNSGAITFTGFSPSVTITKVEVSYCTNSSKGAGTLTATYGTNQLGTFSVTKPSSNGTTLKTATLYNNSTGTTCNATDNFVLSASATANSVYINSVTITYSAASTSAPSLPVFSPGAGAVASGTKITITSDGATSIRYTTDGSTEPTSTTGTLYDENNKPTITAATTLKAIGINANGTSSVATAAYTIAQGTTYERITSTDDLDTDAKYIIVVESLNKAFQNSGTTISASDVTINLGTITLPAGGATEFTLGGSSDNYTLSTGGYYLSNTSQTGVNLNTNSNTWSIVFDGNYVKIHHTVGTTDRILMYNSGFKAYAASNYDSYDKVSLYKEAGGHNVNIASGIIGGTVTSDKNKAKENATVTLTVTPDAGYAIGTVSYTPEGGSATTITPVNGVYSFTMPDANVTVSATFTAIHYTINLDVQPSAASTAGCTIPLPSQASVFLEDNVSKSTVGQTVRFRMHTVTGWVVPSDYLPTVTYSGGTCTVTRKSTQDDGATFEFTMPAADVTISATFTDYAEPLWLLGNNLENASMPYAGGTPMTYANGNYTLTTYFKGHDSSNGVYYGSFCFTKKNDATGWDDAAPNGLNTSGKRIGPSQGDHVVINDQYREKPLGTNSNSFWIPAGIYTITVNKACTIVTITPITDYGVTLSPNGGDVETGSSVTASETLSAALKAINSDLSDNCATLALSLDGGNTFVDGASHEFSNSDVGTKSVVGKAYYGHIETTSAPATFTVTRADNSNKYQLVTNLNQLVSGKKYLLASTGSYNTSGVTYNYEVAATGYDSSSKLIGAEDVTISDNIITVPSGSSIVPYTLTASGNAWTLTNSITNKVMYFFISADQKTNQVIDEATDGYSSLLYVNSINSSTGVASILINSDDNGRGVFFNPNSAGTDPSQYRFSSYKTTSNMKDVKLFVQMKTGKYTITYDDDLTGGTVGGTTDADKDDQVEVTVTPDATHVVGTVTYSYGGNDYTITPNGEGKYIFTMPDANVTVSATFTEVHTVTCAQVTGGTITANPTKQVSGGRVDLTFEPASGYQLVGTPTYTTDNNVTSNVSQDAQGWYITMYDHDVTVNATFALIPHTIAVQHVNGNGTVTGLPDSSVPAGTAVNLTVTPSSGFVVTGANVIWDGGSLPSSQVNLTDNGNGTYGVAFSMPSYDATVQIIYFASDDYEMVTSLSDLMADETYLIVGAKNENDLYVMGAFNSDHYDAVSVTPDAYGYIKSTEAMNLVTFTPGTGDNAGKYAVHTADGYISSGNIHASDPSYIELKMLKMNDESYLVEFVGTNFKFNTSTPRWKAYGDNFGALSYIYKVANKNQVSRPVITDAIQDANQFIGKDMITITCATDGAAIQYSLDEGASWATYSEPFEISTLIPDATITVTARATKAGMETSREVSVLYTCIRPDAPTFGNNTPGDYVNPTYVYPKRSTANYSKYGVGDDREAAFTYYYTLDGSEPTIDAAHKVDGTQSSVPVGKNSNGPFIYCDHNVNLQAVVVINGIPSLQAGGEYNFTVGAPSFSLASGTYEGDQNTRIGTLTTNSLQNKQWRTYIYYTTDPDATWIEDQDWFTDNTEPGGLRVTNDAWTQYDPVNSPLVQIPAGGTTTLRAVTVSEYINKYTKYTTPSEWKFVASTISQAVYTAQAGNLAIEMNPAPGTYVNAQNVTLSTRNAVGTPHIYYNITNNTNFNYPTEGDEIVLNNEDGWVQYTGPITMSAGKTTIHVFAFDDRDETTGKEAERTEDYIIGVQPVTFSPIGSEDITHPANYYNGNQTLEMYSVSPKARVYYAIAEAAGGTVPEAPATPDLNSLRYSDDVTITLEAGKSYAVTAVAYVGRIPSTPRTVYYTINAADGNIPDVHTMNTMATGSTGTMSNPMQVVYMSTHQHNGVTPEFAYVRDNSGYGLVYFGNAATKYDSYTKYKMGDWIPGDAATAKIAVWDDGFHNEFGSNNKEVNAWPSASIGNTKIIPETTTCAEILAGWDAAAYASSTATGSAKYAAGVKENNLWGHYVHLRKNTIEVLTKENTPSVSADDRHKHMGIITGETGTKLTYYDTFYNFSGYNGTPDYGPSHFEREQNEGATYDVYGIVLFYGPLVSNRSRWGDYPEQPFEVAPIDFLKIYKPRIYMDGALTEGETTQHESKTITLTCASTGAQVWYKTSEMESYELYTQPFTVSQSTTIETYSTLPTKYNDELESVVNTLVLNIGEVAQPVISPNSVVKAVGDDAVNCTITCDTERAVIYYTTDGSDPSDENGTREIYNEPLSFSTTTTVRAIAEEGGYYSTEAESRTYTFVYSNGIVFDLVTDESQLDESSVYIIVNQESHMAMSNAQKENNRGATGVMFVDEATKARVYGNADVALLTLRKYGNNFQFYTTNGLTDAADGYLCVGNGNKLLTESAQDNEANCDATIEITSDNKAHIHFLYNSEVDRYLRFWKRDNLFNCYTTESNGDVYLYRVMATPLATIEEFGTTVKGKNQYTIADELVCVWQSKNHLWCKDQGNVSIWRTAPLEGQEDFMMSHSTYGAKRSNKTWDQSNWVRIDFDNTTSGGQAAQNCVGHLLDAATISALFIDKNNYTMSLPGDAKQELTKVNEVTSKEATAEQLELNVYGPANFLEKNLRLNADDQGAFGSDGKYYYLVNPKVQEVCIITWAVWNSESNQFVIPAAKGTNNPCDFDGAISIGTWAYNSEGNQSANLRDGEAYTFTAVVESVGNGYGPARIISGKGGQTASGNVKVSPLNFDPTKDEQIVTDVQAVKTGREVAGVTYYNVAGQMSKTPFEGSVNIVVTKYTDGTKKTAKVVF